MTEYEAASLAVQPAGLTAVYWQTGLSALTSAVSSGRRMKRKEQHKL